MRVLRVRIRMTFGLAFLLAFGLVIIVALIFVGPSRAAEGPRIAGTFGLGYHVPTGGDIGDRYAGAPAFEAGVEFDHPRGLLALETGLRRSTATLNGPFFIEDAKGTLTAVPIDLLARWPLSRGSLRSPYGGLGLELLWIRESFEYRLEGENQSRDADSGLHPGFLMVVGIDRNQFPRFRLEGSFSYVPMHRVRNSAGSTYEQTGSAVMNAGGFGARLCWRLP
jgi:hypothetical protein